MSARKRSVLAVTVLIVAFCVMMAWLVAGDPISQGKWDGIHQGMTKIQVETILGTPTSHDGNQIEYSRPLNVGWVEFAFDEKDVLIWKNDESAFGSLK